MASVRKLIRILEEKGHLRHTRRGREFVYRTKRRPNEVGRSAAEHLLDTFFAGSTPRAVAALFDAARDRISDEDFDRLSELIEKARREGR